MSGSGAHFDGVRAAAAVGIMTSGILSGAIISASAWGIPAILTTASSSSSDAPLTTLRAFTTLYNRGKSTAPPLAALASASFAYAALRASNVPFITNGSFAAAHRSLLFGAAAVLTVGIVPFTFAVMMRGIRVLVRASEGEGEARKLGEGRAVEGVVAWGAQNYVRGLLPLVGCALGTWASFAS
ncbi:unnamed protein product [Peniophora sp. CBMAI 1063]|nr:unnamed protein product [Peniophora sp. CBMAI 1063]